MEVTQFYLHLPASLDKFPTNTLTEYRVCLPQTISLTGDWELALTEIHYPHSWNNVQGNAENRFYLRNQELDGMWESLIVPPGYYSSVADLITKINEVINANDRFKDELQLSFNTLIRKVTVHLQNKGEVYFSDIGQTLGFSPNKVISRTSTAERAVDLEHGFHDLYVRLRCYTITICQRSTCFPPSNRTCTRQGWGENQQVIYSPEILTCQQKAIWIHRSQYKAGHRRNCTIRVWERVSNTSFSTEQICKFLNAMKKFYTPNHKLYEEYYLNQAKQKGGNLPAFHWSRFQRGYGLGSIFKGLSVGCSPPSTGY